MRLTVLAPLLAAIPGFALAQPLTFDAALDRAAAEAPSLKADVAAEFGAVMLIYLKAALAEYSDAESAVRAGALLRVRPKAMTVAVILAGLFPILIGTGTGSEVMSRIAAPMIGGMLTAPLLSMLIIPAAYLLMRRRTQVQHQGETA